MEENLQLIFSFLFDYTENHDSEDDRGEFENIIHQFKQNGYEIRKVGAELVFILHKNRFVAHYLLEKLDNLIKEFSYEIDVQIRMMRDNFNY